MELDGRLCSDPLLKQFFNEYLKLEVWPVELEYDDETGTINECCLATDRRQRLWRSNPTIRCSLLDWVQRRRWGAFLRSRLFLEYRLCCTLNGVPPASRDLLVMRSSTPSLQGKPSHSPLKNRASASSRMLSVKSLRSERVGLASSDGCYGGRESVMSSALPEELWSDDEEHVAMETWSEDKTPVGHGISCCMFLWFKASLSATSAATLIQLWLDVEAWRIYGEHSSLDLRNIREIYYSTIQSEMGVCTRPPQCKAGMLQGEEWIKDAQRICIDKLVGYWLPRFNAASRKTRQASPTPMKRRRNEDELSDSSLPFVNGLRCNALAGSPFQYYIIREQLDEALPQLQLWEACDKVLTHQFNCSDQQLLRSCWNVWRNIDKWITSKGVCCDLDSSEAIKKRDELGVADWQRDDLGVAVQCHGRKLCHALQSSDVEGAKIIVELVEGELLGDLKRLWTRFLREDYDSYLRCLRLTPNCASSDANEITQPPKRFRRRKLKKKRQKSSVLLDLYGTPLEPLRDGETVAVFEEFLLSEYGEHSEELLGYHLWRAVTSCLAQKNKEKREAMALKIQQKYIFTDSEHHVDLSGSQLDLVDPMQEVERPCTAALHGIQSAAAKILSKLVENYLLESGEMKDSIGSFVSLNYKPRESVANKVNVYSVRNEIQHFSETLEQTSVGPISHQLKSFSLYLEEHSPLSQRKSLLNNVQFWLEVKKFNNMYLSGVNMQVLLGKGEALIDRYLDTTTPPWVKVTVSAELAAQVVSAAADLAKVKVPNHIYRLNDLLGRCQKVVFLDMVPYWARFCQQYVAPDGSTVTLPPVSSCVQSRSSTGRQPAESLHLPPLNKRDRTPLLSYSKHKGVQWKFAVNSD